uniref:Uncharacterized protein n=1 Tax=Arundo donax TaxID=35708 RepID=A0A0A9H6R6_ARUDO
MLLYFLYRCATAVLSSNFLGCDACFFNFRSIFFLV